MIARSLGKMQKLTSKYDNTNNQIKHIKCDVLIPSQIFSTCKEIKSWSNDKVNLLVNNVGGGPGSFRFQLFIAQKLFQTHF